MPLKIKLMATAALLASLLGFSILTAAPALAYSGRHQANPPNITVIRHRFGNRGFGLAFGYYRLMSPQTGATTALTPQASTVAQQASPAVVYINAYKNVPTYSVEYTQAADGTIQVNQTQTGTVNQEISSGSGFFITSGGYILTNKHVVSDATNTYMVNYNNTEIPAQVIYRDPNYDLAIVKVDGNNYPTLPLADSSGVTVGENVVAVGNALGRITDYATQGTVTALSQNITVDGDNGSAENLQNVLQTNAKLYPGDSGGPLLDLNGKVIGVNTATTVGSRFASAGFSIPINTAKSVISAAGITM